MFTCAKFTVREDKPLVMHMRYQSTIRLDHLLWGPTCNW